LRTPPRPKTELGRMAIPEEGSTYMQKSTSEFALRSSGGFKNSRGSSSSRSVPGLQPAGNQPDSGRRPPSSRAMPGEEVSFMSPPSVYSGRGLSKSSRSKPSYVDRMASPEMFLPSSGASTPVRMNASGRMDYDHFKRMPSGPPSGHQTPTGRTARSYALSETQRSIKASDTGSAWAKLDGGGGTTWQKEPDSRLDFVSQTPGKWLSCHPVCDRPSWSMNDGRIRPGGPLRLAGGLAVYEQ
jgi:hypothetical protein